MKNKLLLVLLGFCFLGFFSCDKKEIQQTQTETQEVIEIEEPAEVVKQKGISIGLENVVATGPLKAYFDLDYQPQNLEEEATDKKTKKIIEANSSDKPTTSVQPGIKDLSEYSIKYSEGKKVLKEVEKKEKIDENLENDKSKAFIVEEWGPKRIESDNSNPSFYVIFSKPVKALSELGKEETTSDIMKIEPPLDGVFRWYGTDHLSFEVKKFDFDVNKTYKISVNENVKSIYGETLKGQRTFTTTEAPLRMIRMMPAYIQGQECAYSSSTGALEPHGNRFFIRTNRMASVDEIKKFLLVKKTVEWGELERKKYGKENVRLPENKILKCIIEADYTDSSFPYWANKPKSDVNKQKSNSFIVTIDEKLERNSRIDVIFANDKEKYYTLKPFRINPISDKTKYTDGNKKSPLKLYFSQKIDASTVLDNISVDLDYELTQENLEINEKSIKIFNLPVEEGSEFTISVSDGLKDIYGQKLLVDGKIEAKVKVPLGIGYGKYLDSGYKMLESQYASKLLYEHQNLLPESYYEIGNIENPLIDPSRDDFSNFLQNYSYVETADTEKDQRKFEEIDLKPYLTNGFGFIGFQSKSRYNRITYWGELETDYTNNRLILQVTDIGVTARIGINKAVVMVRSLSTGKPINNAVVKILHQPEYTFAAPDVLETYHTDENGLAIINFSEETINRITEQKKFSHFYGDGALIKYLVVCVENGDDKAIFKPNSHNPWRHNVDTIDITRVRDITQKTFAFVDRGIYKPGETVTFRGIDRNQILGKYEPVTGPYKITVEANWWNGPTIVEEITGELSESGGFYGSFKVPEDCSTGPYVIKYARIKDGKTQSFKKIHTFTVAEFERLKFEGKVEIPDLNYYGGDSVNSRFSANYLAGGSISGGEYHSKWYRQRTDFRPKTPDSQNYSFATNTYSYYKSFISENYGTLDSKGSGEDNCKTYEIEDGNPYIYKNEVSITDVSNQKISASTNVLVHPASFYIGLQRARNVVGYAKKGTTLEIPYILVDVKGNKLSSLNKVSSLEYKLIREDWVMVHEQAVDGEIYSRYERQENQDSAGTVKIASNGILKLTPSESGWYTLTLTGKDSSNNVAKSTLEFYVTGGRNFWYNENDSCGINLTPDKAEYLPGETAQILLESPLETGDYLVTVEREGIFVEEVIHLDSPTNVLDVKIDSKFVPVVYVSVSSYSMRKGPPTHEYGEVDLDKPKGYYGITKLFVNPNVRSFTIDIDLEKEAYKPGEEVTIDLETTKNGNPLAGVELTVMAVDRGILDLIDYHVPNPIEFFYNADNFPLGVFGGDSRALLMDPITYSVESLKGGDSDEEKEDERKDFRPTAVFEPVVITDENGRAKVTFTMPDSLTTYRITAFGVKNDLFALKESEITVQNLINVQQVQPRKLRERDMAECGVLISNLDKFGHDITVELEVRTPEGNTFEDEREGRKTVPGKAFVEGANKHTIYVNPGDSSVVYFNVGAEKQGTVELIYKVNSEVLNEKLISTIKIEKTYVYETVTSMNALTEKEKSAIELLEIPTNIEDGRGDITFTMDATRLGLLGGAVNYVFKYPYGCMEQQSAKVLPLVAFEEYIDVFELNSEVSDIKKCVTHFTNEWRKSQLYNGGFPYWSGGGTSNYYVSLRIAHIYALAIKNGYTPEEIGFDIEKLKSYLNDEIYYKGYYCYVSSLLGNNTSKLQKTREELYNDKENLSFEDLAYLGLSYSLDGDTKAKEIRDYLSSYLVPSERSVTLLSRQNSVYRWYSSTTKELALILQLFVCNNPDDMMIEKLLYTLMHSQSHGYWQNTVTTATVLEAISTYIQKLNLENTNYDGTINFANKEVFNEHFEGLAVKPKTLKLPFEGDIISSINKDKQIKVEFKKNGTGRLFYTTEMRYALKDENLAARNAGLGIEYTITDVETGEVINTPDNTTNKIVLENGKTYKVKVLVQSYADRDYVAMRCPIPSGAEVLDSTFVTTGSDAESSPKYRWYYLSHKDIRDNEVQFFWNRFYDGIREVEFTFRAVRRGIYPLPPVQAECMYEPEIFGRSDGYLCVIQ